MAIPINKLVKLDAAGLELAGATNVAEFQELNSNFAFKRKYTETMRRPGIDGVGIRVIGTGGRPFTMTSHEYVADFAAARARAKEYIDWIGSGTQYGLHVYQHSILQGVAYVLAAEPLPEKAVGAVVGSLVATPGARLSVQWHLINEGTSSQLPGG